MLKTGLIIVNVVAKPANSSLLGKVLLDVNLLSIVCKDNEL